MDGMRAEGDRRQANKRAASHRVPDRLFALQEEYVSLAGEIVSAVVEKDRDPRKNDHVWINVRAGAAGLLQVSLSTCSRQSRAAGFDARVRVGVIESGWSELPPAGVRQATPLDYRALEAAQEISYVALGRVAMEELLMGKARSAFYIEAWGEFYIRAHIGIHQVHSRRGSFAVPNDLLGRDGAVQFYFREPNVRELLLLKFSGQP